MNQDFVLYHHRELCNDEKFVEAREYVEKHKLSVDWSHISSLILKEQFKECLYYIKGFYDHQRTSENPKNDSDLKTAFVMLENFVFVENKENLDDSLEIKIRRLLLPNIPYVSKKFQSLDIQTKSKNFNFAAKNPKDIVNKKKLVFLDYKNRNPLKKRFMETEKQIEPIFVLEEKDIFEGKKKKKYQKKSNSEEELKDRIFEVFEAINEPISWDVLRDLIPGNKTEIFQILNQMVKENMIEMKQITNSNRKSKKTTYYYELSTQEVFHFHKTI